MDKISRSLLKTFSYRISGTALLMMGAFLLTNNIALSITLGGIEFIVKLILYFIHERAWNLISWGKDTGKIIWLTGLPSSGKTTIANALEKKLTRIGSNVIKLDGDIIREIFPNTGFSIQDRSQHVERVGKAAILMAKHNITVICSLISPIEEDREKIKQQAIDNNIPFYLTFVKCSIAKCIKRDEKGLYAKAMAGEIKDFTGISQLYDIPKSPDIVIDTEELNIKHCVSKIINEIKFGKLLNIKWV